MEWQEEHAFKNNTFNKALEEDEAEFLDAVDNARSDPSTDRQDFFTKIFSEHICADATLSGTGYWRRRRSWRISRRRSRS